MKLIEKVISDAVMVEYFNERIDEVALHQNERGETTFTLYGVTPADMHDVRMAITHAFEEDAVVTSRAYCDGASAIIACWSFTIRHRNAANRTNLVHVIVHVGHGRMVGDDGSPGR